MRHLGLYLVLVACANNVPQDRSTGPDGKQKGAKAIALQDGEGRAAGVVTYPGGDRVDWKKIELPDGKRGALDLRLTWQSPRPGLQVSFDVFDQWNAPIMQKAVATKRTRSQLIPDAKGTYWVRVFAPKRGDAGQYKLAATFKEEAVTTGPDLTVPDPPRLPAVPAPEATCDTFDVKNDACRAVCDALAPKDWPGCDKQRKQEAAAAACEQAKKDYADQMKTAPKPVTVKILNVASEGDETRITLGYGTNAAQTLDTTWTGEVLSSGSGKPLASGTIKILNVGKTQIQAKVKMRVDALNTNRDVRLTPPAAAPPPRC